MGNPAVPSRERKGKGMPGAITDHAMPERGVRGGTHDVLQGVPRLRYLLHVVCTGDPMGGGEVGGRQARGDRDGQSHVRLRQGPVRDGVRADRHVRHGVRKLPRVQPVADAVQVPTAHHAGDSQENLRRVQIQGGRPKHTEHVVRRRRRLHHQGHGHAATGHGHVLDGRAGGGAARHDQGR